MKFLGDVRDGFLYMMPSGRQVGEAIGGALWLVLAGFSLYGGIWVAAHLLGSPR